jgi:predicted metal-binding protein
VEDGPAILVCNSCRRSKDAGASDGALLARMLRAVAHTESRYAGLAVQEMPCLFACRQSCAIHLRAPGRIGYILGGFAADDATVRAILDYAAAHAASAIGEVPFDRWPEGVKGHFIARMPPPGYVVT